MTLRILTFILVVLGVVSAQEPPADTAGRVNRLLATMATAAEKMDRTKAAEELIKLGKNAVPALTSAIKNDNPAVRYHAAAILGGLGADGAAAVPGLITAARSPKEEAGVRQRAIYSLGEIRADEQRCVPFLLETFQSGDAELAELAGEAIGKFGSKAKGAVPGLEKMIGDRRGKLEIVVGVLGKIGPEARSAVPALQDLLADPKYKEIKPLIEKAIEQIQAQDKQKLPEITKEHLTSKVPNFFYFDYDFEPLRGKRLWLRIDDKHFVERYADGHENKFMLIGRTKVAGNQGTIVVKIAGDEKKVATPNDGAFQVFIPDRGSEQMKVVFRNIQIDGAKWNSLSFEMKKVE